MNTQGRVEKIYHIPPFKEGHYDRTNPVINISERNQFLHIITGYYLYILKDDKVVNHFNIVRKKIKWFEHGFVIIDNHDISMFTNSGVKIGSISFKNKIKEICYSDNNVMIETSKGAFLFRVYN